MSRVKKISSFLKKRWWIVLIVVAVVAFIVYNATRPTIVAGEEQYTVKRQNLSESLSFAGTLDAGEQATLQFQTAGQLSFVGPKVGDRIKKNQLIASLDKRQVQKTLQKYLNSYAKERIDFDNEKKSYDERALPGDKYLRQNLIDAFSKAQYDLTNSVLDVELQDLSLQYSNLYSPIDGVVVKMGKQFAGENISPAGDGFEIVNPGTIYFSAAADQTEVVQLQENMEADISFDAFPDQDTKGRIISIGYVPKEGETGTVYEVKIGLNALTDRDSMKYRMGMTGDATFILKKYPDVLSVPSTYVQEEGNKKFVYKQVKGKPEKTYIQTGAALDTDTIITGGLQEGDVVYDTAP